MLLVNFLEFLLVEIAEGSRTRTTKTGNAWQCRFGCPTDETVDHIFLTCPYLQTERDQLRTICLAIDSQYCLPTLFTHPELKVPVERFLLEIINTPPT